MLVLSCRLLIFRPVLLYAGLSEHAVLFFMYTCTYPSYLLHLYPLVCCCMCSQVGASSTWQARNPLGDPISSRIRTTVDTCHELLLYALVFPPLCVMKPFVFPAGFLFCVLRFVVLESWDRLNTVQDRGLLVSIALFWCITCCLSRLYMGVHRSACDNMVAFCGLGLSCAVVQSLGCGCGCYLGCCLHCPPVCGHQTP